MDGIRVARELMNVAKEFAAGSWLEMTELEGRTARKAISIVKRMVGKTVVVEDENGRKLMSGEITRWSVREGTEVFFVRTSGLSMSVPMDAVRDVDGNTIIVDRKEYEVV